MELIQVGTCRACGPNYPVLLDVDEPNYYCSVTIFRSVRSPLNQPNAIEFFETPKKITSEEIIEANNRLKENPNDS
jgi:hypothetical protein